MKISNFFTRNMFRIIATHARIYGCKISTKISHSTYFIHFFHFIFVTAPSHRRSATNRSPVCRTYMPHLGTIKVAFRWAKCRIYDYHCHLCPSPQPPKTPLDNRLSPLREPQNADNREEKCQKFWPTKKKVLPLHPQTSNDGGIAQLVRASDS